MQNVGCRNQCVRINLFSGLNARQQQQHPNNTNIADAHKISVRVPETQTRKHEHVTFATMVEEQEGKKRGMIQKRHQSIPFPLFSFRHMHDTTSQSITNSQAQ